MFSKIILKYYLQCGFIHKYSQFFFFNTVQVHFIQKGNKIIMFFPLGLIGGEFLVFVGLLLVVIFLCRTIIFFIKKI